MKGFNVGKHVVSKFTINQQLLQKAVVNPTGRSYSIASQVNNNSSVNSAIAVSVLERCCYTTSTTVTTGKSGLSMAQLTCDNTFSSNRRQRTLATTSNNATEKKPSLKETVERLQREEADKNESGEQSQAASNMNDSSNDSSKEQQQEKSTTSTISYGDILRRGADIWDQIKSEVSSTWNELIRSGERKSINKKIHIHPTETAGGDTPYTGPVEIMMIDPELHLTAWERMQKRLTAAPIIQSILERTEEIYEKSGVKKIKERVDHVKEDAREAWETSQNPWVYRISSVYDTVTAESPETRAVAELRILDPTFTLEDWRQDVVEHTLPIIMKWFLQGRINQLKPWLGEGVFKRIAAEMMAREKEGTQIDTNVLAIMNSEIIAVEPDDKEKGSPIIILHFMCQQINCVRKKKTGEIVEGSEDDIRANSYVVAFQREYNEASGELNWKIIDFRFNGAIAYL